ncbi:hypothetical protein BLL42_17160 [Pseudomonas frederiksbergensis]|uniref:Uncharacterized protein n=1 Tax=Pseudomonas frederiksbergensis TaxID=104087 RepID=A0A1J0EN44_9PSED|nr:hypothetical protein [Pseudomonas frederiksbergensis]APC17383.1 hypothetical protein BLL42_17160 [Pseudomonas frederiksbergensis]
MITASEILSRINDGVFLELVFKENPDWDAELGSRDSVEFFSAWNASYETITSSCPPEDGSIKEIRESAFKKVYQITKNPDLAGCVSDDLGLIAQAFKNKVDIDFINDLWKAYTQGSFPN